jgi:Holliday junction resolvase
MHSQQKLGAADKGRKNFVVIEVKVEAIDWLQINKSGQIRALLRAAHGWRAEPLVR